MSRGRRLLVLAAFSVLVGGGAAAAQLSLPAGLPLLAPLPASGVPGPATARALSTSVDWEEPYGDRARRTGFPFTDPTASPYPYVLFGRVENLGDTAVSPRAVGAWLDASNRVLAIADLPRVTISETDDSAVADTCPADPDDSSMLLYTNDDPRVADTLDDAEFVVWSGGEGS